MRWNVNFELQIFSNMYINHLLLEIKTIPNVQIYNPTTRRAQDPRAESAVVLSVEDLQDLRAADAGVAGSVPRDHAPLNV